MKLHPEIILKASNNNKTVGAFRFWVLAKDYDRGSGFIPAKDFRRYLTKELNIPRSTIYRWIDAAQKLGLIEYNGDVYRLAAWEVGAMIAGVTELKKPARMPLEDFVKKGWMACVWAAYHSLFEGPISRAFMEANTSVPYRTQREYETQAGIKRKFNYADLGDPVKDPDNAYVVEEGSGAFGGSNGHTWRQLPNSYEVPSGYGPANYGNTGRRNKKLRDRESHNVGGIPIPQGRLYCDDDKQLKRAKSQAKRQDAQNRWENLFQFRWLSQRSGSGVYDAVAL